MDQARLQNIYESAGRPGASALRFHARRAGLEISEAEAKAFVASQSSSQVFSAQSKSDGRIPSGGKKNIRCQADLIDYSKKYQS